MSEIQVDTNCPNASQYKVHADYNAMLNQTNIGANNNKFYVIQVLEKGGKFFVWNRWGRVGEGGQSALKPAPSADAAVKEFSKKFREKTVNSWEDRKSFKPSPGKYTLIEIDTDADGKKKAEPEARLAELAKNKPAAAAVVVPNVLPCSLVPQLQSFIKLIFDKDMFQSAMASFEIDVKKMPLGQLSKSQVQKGFEALEEIEHALNAGRTGELNTLASKFYTVIPHDFGRKRPPAITTAETLQKKRDMLNVLADIEVALGMENKATAAAAAPVENALPHPIDANYKTLKADLVYVDPKSDEYTMIDKYLVATREASGYYKPELLDVFRVDRHTEGDRFKAHDTLDNRKLLWHGTNVAVVAAILGSGLRIMPHSGGRVGRGIYLASENGKSIHYVGPAGNTGVMFLAEAALGKEHHIWKDDPSLRNPPKGFDSILAKGHTEPDPKDDITWEFEGRKVTVPQGKPIAMKDWKKSSFTQTEYLLYQESQVRIRYVLKINMR